MIRTHIDPDFDPDPDADRPEDGGGLPAALDHLGVQLTYFDDSPGAAR